MVRALTLLGCVLLGSTAAQAIDINCGVPLVDIGDARQGPGSSRDVRVAIDERGFGWQVFHDLNDGRVISRGDQYGVYDFRNPETAAKLGYDTGWGGLLNTNRNLYMHGRLYEHDGMLYYSEQLRDFKRNPQGDVIMMSTAYCGADPGGARWRAITRQRPYVAPPSPPPPPPQVMMQQPVPALMAPPPAASLAPPDPHPVVAPPITEATPSNSVPIVVINDRARVAVSLGDYPLPQTMVVDTGASVMNLPRELAAELIKRGVATADGTLNICIADGSCTPRVRIWIDKVTVGPRVVQHVAAVVAPDGSELLLPFSVITNGGRATIDTEKGLLIFG
jgi:hypothetical protein